MLWARIVIGDKLLGRVDPTIFLSFFLLLFGAASRVSRFVSFVVDERGRWLETKRERFFVLTIVGKFGSEKNSESHFQIIHFE